MGLGQIHQENLRYGHIAFLCTPAGAAHADSYAAKRIRKMGQRRAVDYTSTVVRYMQVMIVECYLMRSIHCFHISYILCDLKASRLMFKLLTVSQLLGVLRTLYSGMHYLFLHCIVDILTSYFY